MTTKTADLYIDTNGGVYCTGHIGYEAESYLAHHPKAQSFTTPLTHWVKATKRDHDEWVAQMDQPMPCFTCHFGH
jgi:hypothetical protein